MPAASRRVERRTGRGITQLGDGAGCHRAIGAPSRIADAGRSHDSTLVRDQGHPGRRWARRSRGACERASTWHPGTHTEVMMTRYTLPELPYDYAALEPHYSARLLELHHDKHHAAYVIGANATLEKLAQARDQGDFAAINQLQKSLAFHLSGHVYFTDGELTVGVLAPEGSAGTHSVTALPSPTPVVIKNQLWSWLRPLLGDGEAAPAPGERR